MSMKKLSIYNMVQGVKQIHAKKHGEIVWYWFSEFMHAKCLLQANGIVNGVETGNGVEIGQ